MLWKRAEGSIWYRMSLKAKHAQDLLKSKPVEWDSYATMKYCRVINQKAHISQPLLSSHPLAICAMATCEAWTREGAYLPWLHCRNTHAVFTLNRLKECVVFSSLTRPSFIFCFFAHDTKNNWDIFTFIMCMLILCRFSHVLFHFEYISGPILCPGTPHQHFVQS